MIPPSAQHELSARVSVLADDRAAPSGARGEKVVASLLAAPASVGAKTAVFVVGGVPVALLGTGQASHCTGFDHRTDKAQIRLSLACDDAAARVAGIGAVEAEANAAHHLPDAILREISVGTARTTGGAIEALSHAAQKHFAVEPRRLRMRLKDRSKRHVSPLVRGGSGLARDHTPGAGMAIWRVHCRTQPSRCVPHPAHTAFSQVDAINSGME